MAEVAVGLDVGTGGARALALDRRGAVVASSAAAYHGDADWPEGRADAHAWLQAVHECLQGLGAAAEGAAAICVGGQSPTTVPDDGAVLAVTCRHPAGLGGSPSEQHQAQRAVIDPERTVHIEPYQLWDWLLHQLGAERHQGRWPGDPPLDDYGPLRTTGDVVGATPEGVPLVTGAQDAYLAFWAAGIDVPGRAVDPGGRTGGIALAVASGTKVPGLWAFRSAARGVDIVGGPVNAHGLALEWLAEITGRDVDSLLQLAAESPPGARGVMLLPYLNGERAPRWNPALRGELSGVRTDTSVADLARATLEASAYGLAHIAMLFRDAGARIDSMVCTGSPARSELWCQIKASVLEVAVEVPAQTDLAAYGAALAAGAGVGWWPRPGEGDPGAWPRPAMRRVEPRPCAAYRAALQRFIESGDAAERRLAAQGEP
jgi:sugar (pentulose or hexulose) kinase